MRRRTRLDSDRPQIFFQKLHLTSKQDMGEKKERKKKLYTPDTEACVPYLTRVQSSVTPNTYVDWTRVRKV